MRTQGTSVFNVVLSTTSVLMLAAVPLGGR
jgi:hypothetical protein